MYHYSEGWKSNFNAEKSIVKSQCLTRTSEYRSISSGPIDFELTRFNCTCILYLFKGISNPIFYGDLVYKLQGGSKTHRNFISSGSKIVKRLRRRQYDPLIIETTIGLVLGPCTALCRLFLKHCTLTNKAVGTIWRALSKPPQRRQGPDLRPLWLLVGTPSAIRPELAFSRAEHSLPYSDVTIYIFAISYLSSMPYV